MSVDERDLAMSEDELARARFAERNSRSRLNDTMRQSFLSPKRAMNRIQKARAKHGDKTVFDKLRDPKSRAYGRRPGSLLSRGGLRGGARRKRHEALLARRRLPEQLHAQKHASKENQRADFEGNTADGAVVRGVGGVQERRDLATDGRQYTG